MFKILKLPVFVFKEVFRAGKPGIAGGCGSRDTEAFIHILTQNLRHSRVLSWKIIIIPEIFVILTKFSVF